MVIEHVACRWLLLLAGGCSASSWRPQCIWRPAVCTTRPLTLSPSSKQRLVCSAPSVLQTPQSVSDIGAKVPISDTDYYKRAKEYLDAAKAEAVQGGDAEGDDSGKGSCPVSLKTSSRLTGRAAAVVPRRWLYDSLCRTRKEFAGHLQRDYAEFFREN